MLRKNKNSQFKRKLHYKIRKLTIGVVSFLCGISLISNGSTMPVVNAQNGERALHNGNGTFRQVQKSEYNTDIFGVYGESRWNNYYTRGMRGHQDEAERRVKVEALTDEDGSYKQKWKITFNSKGFWMNESKQPYSGNDYNSGGYKSNPYFSFMLSDDLEIDGNVKFTVNYRQNDQSNIAGTGTYEGPLKSTSGNEYLTSKINASGGDYARLWRATYLKRTRNLARNEDNLGDLQAQLDQTSSDGIFRLGLVNQTDTHKVHNFDGKTKVLRDVGTIFGSTLYTSGYTGKNADVVVEFTTKRDPKRYFSGAHRTFVAGEYNSWDWNDTDIRTEVKYVDHDWVTDTDHDGLTDLFEAHIGSNPLVADTDDDGKTDGVVAGKSPDVQRPGYQQYGNLWKIPGTDPIQAPPNLPDTEYLGMKGEIIEGIAAPNSVVALYEYENGKRKGVAIAETIADKNGKYTLVVGKVLGRTTNLNKWNNNIQLANNNEKVDGSFVPVLVDRDYTITQGNTLELTQWSDGLDGRPLFSEPELARERREIVSLQDKVNGFELNPKQEVADSILNDSEKNSIKDKLKNHEDLKGIIKGDNEEQRKNNIKVNPDGSVELTLKDDSKVTIAKDKIVEQSRINAPTVAEEKEGETYRVKVTDVDPKANRVDVTIGDDTVTLAKSPSTGTWNLAPNNRAKYEIVTNNGEIGLTVKDPEPIHGKKISAKSLLTTKNLTSEKSNEITANTLLGESATPTIVGPLTEQTREFYVTVPGNNKEGTMTVTRGSDTFTAEKQTDGRYKVTLPQDKNLNANDTLKATFKEKRKTAKESAVTNVVASKASRAVNPQKAVVANKNSLTETEKTQVKNNIKTANNELRDTDITVNTDGTATVRFSDGSTKNFTQDQTVVEKSKAPLLPEKITTGQREFEVRIPDGATPNGTLVVKKGETNFNVQRQPNGTYKVTVPQGTDLNVGDSVVATYTENGKAVSDESRKTVADKEDSATPTIVNTPAIHEQTREIFVSVPNGTGDGTMVVTRGSDTFNAVKQNDGRYKVTIPEGKKLNPNDSLVAKFTENGKKEKASTPVTVASSRAKLATNPDKVAVDNKNSLKQDEKDKIKAEIKKKNNGINDSNIEVENNGRTTVTFPDGSRKVFEPDVTIMEKSKVPTIPTVHEQTKEFYVTVPDGANTTGNMVVKKGDTPLTVQRQDDGRYKVTVPSEVTLTKDDVITAEFTETGKAMTSASGRVVDSQSKNATAPSITTVLDPNQLTEQEKNKIKDEIVKVNGSNVNRDNIQVSGNGTTTVTFNDGSKKTFEPNETVAAKEKSKTPTIVNTPAIHDQTNEFYVTVDGGSDPGATMVVNKGDTPLTVERQNDGRYKVTLPSGTTLNANDTITATYTEPNKTATTSETVTVAQSKATRAQNPTVTPVENTSRLTADEKQRVKNAIKTANPSLGLTDGQITVSENGSTTVTFDDGSTKTYEPNLTVSQASKSVTPTLPDKIVEGQKEFKVTVPNNTQGTLTVKVGNKTLTSARQEDGSYKVTVPEGTNLRVGDTIEATFKELGKPVSDKATKTVVQSEASKFNPTNKNISVDKNTQVNPKDTLETGTLPPTATYKFVDERGEDATLNTAEPGNKTAKVKVTYPDGSSEVVDVTVHVNSDADKATLNGKEITVKKGQPVSPSDFVQDYNNVPNKKSVDYKNGAPDTSNVSAEKDVTVVVTFNDGSTKEVTGKLTVQDLDPSNKATDLEHVSNKLEAKLPKGTPAETKIELVDNEGNPIIGKNKQPITGTVDPATGKVTIPLNELPDNVTDVKIRVTEPGKNPTVTDKSLKLDKNAPEKPVVTAPDYTDSKNDIVISNIPDDAKTVELKVGDKTITLTKGDNGNWTSSDEDFPVRKDDNNNNLIVTPSDKSDLNNKVISAKTTDKAGNVGEKSDDVTAKTVQENSKKPTIQQGIHDQTKEFTVTVPQGADIENGSLVVKRGETNLTVVREGDHYKVTVPADVKLSKNDVITATFTEPDKLPTAADQVSVVESKASKAKNPTVILVENSNNLTPQEKERVKNAIKEANPDLAITDKQITVDANGATTVTFDDGSVKKFESTNTVRQANKSITPVLPDNIIEGQKEFVVTVPQNTQGTLTVKVGETPLTVADQGNGSYKVTVPEGTNLGVGNTVEATFKENGKPVSDKATKTVVQSQASQYNPTNKNISVNKNATVNPKDTLETGTLPPAAKYEFVNENGEGTTFSTAESGDKTAKVKVTYPDGSSEVVDVTVHVNTDAEGNELVDPSDKVAVDDPNQLSETEKDQVKDKIKATNPNLDKNQISVDNKGNVTVTYPDGSTNTIDKAKTVVAKETSAQPVLPTINDQTKEFTVTVPNNVDGNLTVKKGDVDLTVVKEGDHYKVTLPEGVTLSEGDTITATFTEDGKKPASNTTNVVESQASKVKNPQKTTVVNKDSLTEEEKEAVKNAIKKSNEDLHIDDSQITVENNGKTTIRFNDGSTKVFEPNDVISQEAPKPELTVNDPSQKVKVDNPTNLTQTEKDQVKANIKESNPNLKDENIVVNNDGSVTVTVDGQTKQIPADKTIEAKKDNEKYDGRGNVTVPFNGTINKDSIVFTPQLPDGATIGELPNVDTSTAGSKEIEVPVTFKDGSKKNVPITVTVEDSEASKTDIVDPTNKVPVNDITNLTNEEKEKIKDEIKKANPNLPTGTVIEVDSKGNVTITYPDKSVDTIDKSKTIKQSDASKYNPTNKNVTVNKGASVNPKDTLNTEGLPETTTYTFVDSNGADTTLDTSNVGQKQAKVKVTYPDKTSEIVDVTVTVTTQADSNSVNDPSEKVKVDNPANLTDAEKEKVKDNVIKANPTLDRSKITVDNEGNVTVTYDDDSTKTIDKSKTVEAKDASVTPTLPAINDQAKEFIVTIPENKDGNLVVKKGETPLTVTKQEDGTYKVTLPNGVTLNEGDTITATFTEDGKKPTNANTTVVASKASKANAPQKTPVANLTNLTEQEKQAVKDEIKKANPELNITDDQITVENNGKTTITFDDGSIKVLEPNEVVSQKETPKPVELTVTDPSEKVKVNDPANLTDDEKAQVKEKVKEANPNLTDDQIIVNKDGSVTVTVGENTKTISPDKTIIAKNDSEKYKVVKPESKVEVANKEQLTEQEKAKVVEEIRKANSNLPENAIITVANNGDATITFPDKSTTVLTDLVTVKEATEAEKDTVNDPEKVKVDDPSNLTDAEKEAVKEVVLKANPDLADKTIEVDKNGNVTITYKDGSKNTIPAEKTVVAKTEAEKYNGSGNVTVPKNGEVNKDEIVFTPELPEGAVVGELPEVDTTTEGSKEIEVPVEFADGSRKNVKVTVEVKEDQATKIKAKDPANKVKVDNPEMLTDAEKEAVKEEVLKANPELPEGTEIEVDNEGNVIITYPDGSMSYIDKTKTVEAKTDAERYPAKNPSEKVRVEDPNNLSEEEKAKVKENVKKANSELPEGVEIEVDNQGNVEITYLDGSKARISSEYTVYVEEKAEERKMPSTGVEGTVLPLLGLAMSGIAVGRLRKKEEDEE